MLIIERPIPHTTYSDVIVGVKRMTWNRNGRLGGPLSELPAESFWLFLGVRLYKQSY